MTAKRPADVGGVCIDNLVEDALGGWPNVRKFVEHHDDGHVGTGVQLCIVVDGQVVVDIASGGNGLGGQLGAESPVRVYCATKPVTAVAVAALVDAGELDLDEPIGDRLPLDHAPGCAHVPLRHILAHTAGLHRPSALEIEILSPSQRAERLRVAAPPPEWDPGKDAAYADFLGWALIGAVIEAVTGEPLYNHLRDHVLDPLGMRDTFIGMTDAEFQLHSNRFACNIDARFAQHYPLLIELSPRHCCETNCSYGGYSTARDLAMFHDAIRRQLKDGTNPALPPPEMLRSFCTGTRGTIFDAVLGRKCDMGLGFMVDLRHHQFGDACAPESFGHSGWSSSAFGFADPTHELAVGAIRTAILPGDSGFAYRCGLVNSVYQDLN